MMDNNISYVTAVRASGSVDSFAQFLNILAIELSEFDTQVRVFLLVILVMTLLLLRCCTTLLFLHTR